MLIRDVFELYKQNMRNINLAESTIHQYSKELTRFINFLEENKIQEISDVKGFHIDMFNALLMRSGNVASTRSRKKSTLNNLFDYALKMEIIERNPVNIIGKIKITDGDTKPKEILSEKDSEKLRKQIEKKSLYKTKNICIINVFSYCAIRVSELSRMKWEDIDFKNKIITVKKGKGRKDRRVPLFKEIEDDLKKLKKEQSPKSDYVFTAKNTGRPMQPRSIHDLIKRHSSAAKIKKNVGCHTFRHTAATKYLTEGVNLRYIQKLLGHSNISTTMRYLNPDEQEVNKALQDAVTKINKRGKNK
ncbi:tyrosine-type recombinase/integrase [Bacillus sp. Brlt_9]|uniref:tyrosine-type recombinase/integrase n=1 Tax=Bacillus sp. Brlt_9 TaxID=3110916 RepID=UPI003F7C19F1